MMLAVALALWLFWTSAVLDDRPIRTRRQAASKVVFLLGELVLCAVLIREAYW